MLDAGRERAREIWDAQEVRTSDVSRALLVLVIVGSVLALGSLHVPILIAVGAVATCSASLALARTAIFGQRIPLPLLVILGLTAVTLLQAIPLPWRWLEQLAPANAEVWAGALSPLSRPHPSFAPLSLDPVATWGEVLKGWTYAAVFIAAMAAGARRGAAWGALVIFGSAATLASLTLAHGVLDASRVFGIYAPRSGASGFAVGPLINPNNCAGYLNLGILAGTSLLALPRPPLPRWALSIALALTVGVSLLTGSRGGLVSLVAGALLLFALLRQADRINAQPLNWKRFVLVGAGSTVLGIAFMLLAAASRTGQLLLARDTTKLHQLVTTLPLIEEFRWFGVGRGAFESAYPAFRTAGNNTIFSHPENFLVQWVAEWGIGVTLALLIVMCLLLRPRLWQVPRNLAACGLFAGAAALALHNLVDLSSEVPGVAIGGVAAAGFAWGNSAGRLGKSRVPWKNMLIVAAIGAAVTAAALAFGRHTLQSDREQLGDELAKRPPWPTFRAQLAQAMQRHPAEPFFPRLGAVAAWRDRRESPMPWLERALERGLSVGRTHYLLAQYLASRGKSSQALLELRLAAEFDPQLASRVATQAVKLTTEPDRLRRTVPEGVKGARLLLNLAHALKPTEAQLAMDLLREAVERDPKMPEPRLLLVRKLLVPLEAPGPPSPERAAQIQEVTRLLDGLPTTTHEARQYRARLLVATGRGSEATAFLARDCPKLDEPTSCIALWLSVARVVKDRGALDAALQSLAQAGCSESRHCADAYWAAGEACQVFGKDETALRHFERFATEANTSLAWQKVARYADQIGRADHALRALGRAQMLSPSDHTLAAAHNAARQRLLKEVQLEQLRE